MQYCDNRQVGKFEILLGQNYFYFLTWTFPLPLPSCCSTWAGLWRRWPREGRWWWSTEWGLSQTRARLEKKRKSEWKTLTKKAARAGGGGRSRLLSANVQIKLDCMHMWIKWPLSRKSAEENIYIIALMNWGFAIFFKENNKWPLYIFHNLVIFLY